MKHHSDRAGAHLSWTTTPAGTDNASLPALVQAVQTIAVADAFRPRFTMNDWRIVGAYLVRRTLQAGETLIRQGSTDRTAFLLESGTLAVHARRESGAPAPIAMLRAGALVGEPALFGETVRMAQVDAISACVVWSLGSVRLEELRASNPGLAFEILRAAGVVMSERMRANIARGTALL